MWVDRILGFGHVVKDLSLGLSCPVHCGGSLLPSFGAGLAFGLLLGFTLSLVFALLAFLYLPSLGGASFRPPAPVPATSSTVRRRLSGYLVHE